MADVVAVAVAADAFIDVVARGALAGGIALVVVGVALVGLAGLAIALGVVATAGNRG